MREQFLGPHEYLDEKLQLMHENEFPSSTGNRLGRMPQRFPRVREK